MTNVFGIIRDQFPNSVSFTGVTQHCGSGLVSMYLGQSLYQLYPSPTSLSVLCGFRIQLAVSLHALCSACACLILRISLFGTVAQAVTFVCFPCILTILSSFVDFLGMLHPSLFNCLETMALDFPNQAQIFHCIQLRNSFFSPFT